MIAELVMHVFVCHAAPDRDAAARLRADLAQIGRQVALDRGEPNGPQWWDTVLSRIRRCGVFVFVVSPDSVRSPGCLAELRYAAALGKPLAAVRLGAAKFPAELADAAVIDAGGSTAERIPRLRATIDAFPPPGPLPQPLPPEPPVPYLEVYRSRLDQPVLDQTTQLSIMTDLRSRLLDPKQRAGAWSLLVGLRRRPDVAPPVAATLENILAPGWQPDPERRVERRYWDGQAWTTLVRHDGREFNERRTPPPETTWEADTPAPAAHRRASAPRTTPRRKTRWVLVGLAVAVTAAGGAVAALVLPGVTAADDDPVKAARTFVDAVNTEDVADLRAVTCERVRGQAVDVFVDLGPLTLEQVNESTDPVTFTVVTTNVVGGALEQRVFPLIRESGEWRVCAP
ncbi:TIR domain-containing protein [Actinokineospora sp. UTMC 2448]|uniref:Rv0361 family membrane protein n=1 Tax=Actinokineospora sp. UTMC 2448 TaxID=2268449 RepID=UPI00216450EF|nr:TIR domain-containing protein [Actinokineospora sp. UTMC 2448]